MFKRLLAYSVILGLLLPILIPLYSNSLLGSADNLAHLFRVVNLDYALSQGYVWPRWAALEGHGFGAPIFTINYVLPYYIVVGLWHLLGSLLHASQIYMILVLFLSACTMFLFTADFFGVAASSIAAVAYVYFPYHLMTIYLYGGYGEAMAYVLLPLVFLFFCRLIRRQSFLYFTATSLCLGILILSHNLSALMAVVLMMTFVPVLWYRDPHKLRTILLFLGTVLSCALITAWFWLPAVYEQQYTKLGILFEKETALRGYFFQLISPVIENSFKLLRLQAPDYYAYAIGIPSILLFALGIFYLTLTRIGIFNKTVHKASLSTRLGFYFIFWCSLSFIMTRSISEPLWNVLPSKFNFFSYPYRFFFITTFATAGITACVVDILWKSLSRKRALVLSAAITALFIWQGYMYSHPNIDTFSFEESYFTTVQTVRYAPNTYKNMGYIEFIPTTADSNFINALDSFAEPTSKVEIVSGQASANVVIQKAQDLYIDINASSQSLLQVNILYFPGWVGIINGKRVIPTVDSVGRMVFPLPKGKYQLHIAFQQTPIRSIATYISFISLFCLMIYGLRKLLSLILRRK